jgi:hypothetical protein
MADDLRGILPAERQVEAGGEQLTLRPFAFRHMLKALPRFGALMEYVKAEEVEGELRLHMDMDQLLAEGGDHLVPLMAMAAGKDAAWVDALDFDEGCRLAAAVMELNADFFARARARAAGASAAPAGTSAGATSSRN